MACPELLTGYLLVDLQRSFHPVLLISLFFLISYGSIYPASAVNVPTPLTISSPGNYVLHNDLLNSNVPVCIDITFFGAMFFLFFMMAVHTIRHILGRFVGEQRGM